jgi:hypothetical protein
MAFVEITGPEYTEFLRKRLLGEVPKLTWLQQFCMVHNLFSRIMRRIMMELRSIY